MKFQMTRMKWVLIAGVSVVIVSASIAFQFHAKNAENDFGLTKQQLATSLGDFRFWPTDVSVPIEGKPTKVVVQYAVDANLQEAMESIFRQYTPDYGALVAIDATTGRILSMVSYTHDPAILDNLALRATFPSASTFKMVTAAAAIEEKKFNAQTIIPFNGKNHTLYRSHILRDKVTHWTRYITLKEAFARSINTVFGKIGAYSVGADELREYAGRFGFNRRIASDLPMQQGKVSIENNPWSLAEAASGYTRETTMSPLQGALMAAAIANDGVMMEPYAVQTVHAIDGTILYQSKAKVASVTVDPNTASQIRELMAATVAQGTSRKSFRGFFKREFSELRVGGKTGSLMGNDPRGKYDWFVGYADGAGRKIAVAALTVHKKLWRVKSSFLARRAIETYYSTVFRERRTNAKVAANLASTKQVRSN